MAHSIYHSLHWRLARTRALARDGRRCTVARLLGGECSATLHVHHIRPVSEGGAPFELDNLGTACDSHHPVWESLRRRLLASLVPVEDRPPVCRHIHRTTEGRVACERRMARDHERRRKIAA